MYISLWVLIIEFLAPRVKIQDGCQIIMFFVCFGGVYIWVFIFPNIYYRQFNGPSEYLLTGTFHLMLA